MRFDILVEDIISKFKPSNAQTVAILPGGFKPPHKGHFNALNYILDEADKGIVFIGKGERDGINAQQSKRIWDIYKKYLKKPVEVTIAEKTPVASTYEYADANPNINIIVGAGPLDEKRFKYFQDNIEKYPLVKIISIPPMYERISGSKVREQLCKKDPKAVDCFVPTDKRDDEEVDLLTAADKQQVSKILKV